MAMTSYTLAPLCRLGKRLAALGRERERGPVRIVVWASCTK